MKKKKVKLREKIRNRPKSRNPQKSKNKPRSQPSGSGASHHHAPQNPEDGIAVMSQVILDFAAPLLATCDDLEAEKKALSMAVFVWNSTLLPEAERDQTLEAYLTECEAVMPAEELKTLKGYIDQLVQDKAARFADNRKKITNCTFGDYGDDRHIEVGYTIE